MKQLFRTIVSGINAVSSHANLASDNLRDITHNAADLARETRKAIIEAAIETKTGEAIGRAKEAGKNVSKVAEAARIELKAALQGKSVEEVRDEEFKAAAAKKDWEASEKRERARSGAQA